MTQPPSIYKKSLLLGLTFFSTLVFTLIYYIKEKVLKTKGNTITFTLNILRKMRFFIDLTWIRDRTIVQEVRIIAK